MDFFINSDLGYGFELLRNGTGITEHADRFEEGGGYWPLIQNGWMKDFLVIDFRPLGLKISSKDIRVVFACYDGPSGRFILKRVRVNCDG